MVHIYSVKLPSQLQFVNSTPVGVIAAAVFSSMSIPLALHVIQWNPSIVATIGE